MYGNRNLILAAKICKLSLFLGYDVTQFVRKHSVLFENYDDVEVSEILDILEKKESKKKAADIIHKACELAGSQIEGRICESSRPLATVFSRVSLSDNYVDNFMHYQYAKLKPENAFPNDMQMDGNLEHLRKEFEKELLLLEENLPDSLEEFEIVFDMIFQKYLWCISISDDKNNDVSLYDYLKLVEAITICLHKSKEEKPFCLVAGDFNGIQKYIFENADVNGDGIAKSLRTRSFYVDCMIRIYAQYIVDYFWVNRANILMQSGGKFYILLPNNSDVEKKLCKMCEYMELELAEYVFQKKVSINLAWEYMDDKGIIQYSDTIVGLTQKLEEKKQRVFSEMLIDDGKWGHWDFILYHPKLEDKHLCSSCRSHFIDSTQGICEYCQWEKEAGRKLANAKYIIYRDVEKEAVGNFFGYEIEVTNEKHFENALWIEVLNDTKLVPSDYAYPITRRYMANHIPHKDGEVLSFLKLANNSQGVKKLAVLKADVDVLGYLFADGLQKENTHYGTIARVNTMSRMLEVFFSGRVNELLSDKKYKDVYSVFSGGDDLFLIGSWNVMMDLALEIQEEFKNYCAMNSDITISAALVRFSPREHIATVAEWSEYRLDEAKNQINEVLYPDKEGRNCINVFGEIMSWEDYRVQMGHVERIAELIKKNSLSSNMLYRLSQYSYMYRRFLLEGKTEGLMAEPYLNYDVKRNGSRLDRWFEEEYLKPMTKGLSNKKEINRNLYFAECVIDIAMKLTR